MLKKYYKFGNLIMEQEIRNKIQKTSKISNYRKMSKNTIVDLMTGEIIEFNKAENKYEALGSVRRTMADARLKCLHYVIENLDNSYFLTLTYEDNMQNNDVFENDCKNFLRNMRRHYPNFEYFLFREKQERGAWHAHLLIWFKENNMGLTNDDVSREWSFKGMTSCDKLKTEIDVKNVVFYLTDYNPLNKNDTVLKKIESLKTIPSNFNLVTSSRGLKKPKPVKISEEDLKKCKITNTSLGNYGIKYTMMIAA